MVLRIICCSYPTDITSLKLVLLLILSNFAVVGDVPRHQKKLQYVHIHCCHRASWANLLHKIGQTVVEELLRPQINISITEFWRLKHPNVALQAQQ